MKDNPEIERLRNSIEEAKRIKEDVERTIDGLKKLLKKAKSDKAQKGRKQKLD